MLLIAQNVIYYVSGLRWLYWVLRRPLGYSAMLYKYKKGHWSRNENFHHKNQFCFFHVEAAAFDCCLKKKHIFFLAGPLKA